jgi:hypothetical protein
LKGLAETPARVRCLRAAADVAVVALKNLAAVLADWDGYNNATTAETVAALENQSEFIRLWRDTLVSKQEVEESIEAANAN